MTTFLEAVVEMAQRCNPNGWMSSETAPETLEALIERTARDGIITVSSLHSERTIFGSPWINAAFRAWHDAVHLAIGAPFTLEGEREVCFEQQRQLEERYEAAVGTAELDFWLTLIRIEVIGQAEYFERTGAFPEDQVAFCIDQLINRATEARKQRAAAARLDRAAELKGAEAIDSFNDLCQGLK